MITLTEIRKGLVFKGVKFEVANNNLNIMEKQDSLKKLLETVRVSCLKKDFVEYEYEEFITYKFIIVNDSDKTIRAVKGSITFTNIFDEEIQTLSFVYDQPIKSKKQITYDATTNYNQFIDEDKALKSKNLKDLKVIWKPEKIIFEDGSTLN